MYVIYNRSNGMYVAQPGNASYTKYLQKARRFDTREAANRDGVCGNEVVISLEEAMQ